MKGVRAGGNVKRWHTVPTIQNQTVGHHSWGVAIICHVLWPNCSRDLLVAALQHDLAEHIVGDAPFPAKRTFIKLGQALAEAERIVSVDLGLDCEYGLNISDSEKLHIADMMEVLWFALEEISMGNTEFRMIFKRGLKYLNTKKLDNPTADMIDNLESQLYGREVDVS